MASKKTAPLPVEENTDAEAPGISPATAGLGTPQTVEGETPPADATSATPPLDETAAPQKRGRGRPPGSGAKKDAKSDAPGRSAGRKDRDVAALGQQIVGIHAVIATLTKIPELMINSTEGEALAKGASAVADEYGISFGGKTGAAIQLFAAVGMVYAPRLFAFKVRMAQEQQQREAAEAAAMNGGAVHGADGSFVAPVVPGNGNVSTH